MIIVCGADNTGKTTLVRHLSEKFNLPQVLRYHMMPPEDYVEWFRWLQDNLTVVVNAQEVIADRFYVEEFVYGPIKRGKVGLSESKIEIINDLVESERPLIILCETDLTTIQKTFGEREQYPELKEIPTIMAKFREVVKLQPFASCPVITYNLAKDGQYKIVDKLVEIYLKGRGYTYECK
jgi:thymidylate kinase